jgi:methionyl-tRNA synthetase
VFFCRYHAIHEEVYDWFNISFDKFGRTSSPEQTQVCHSIFKKLFDNKLLTEGTVKQHYCDTCERFLADRFVEGICPTLECDYDYARGDQCDKCGKLLKQTDLTNPRCKVVSPLPKFCGIISLLYAWFSWLILGYWMEMYWNF